MARANNVRSCRYWPLNSKARLRAALRTDIYLPKPCLKTESRVCPQELEDYVGFRAFAVGREIAALLCRRYTGCTLAELSAAFGLRHPDSSANLVRRAKQREETSQAYRCQVRKVEHYIFLKTEKQN